MDSFRDTVQAGVVSRVGDESVYGKIFSRHFSHRISHWIVSRTRITANEITVASVLFGLSGWLLIAMGLTWSVWVGLACLHTWLILDAVDGEVARARQQCSKAGLFLDRVGHYCVNPYILASSCAASYKMSSNTLFVVGGCAFVWFWNLRLSLHDLGSLFVADKDPAWLSKRSVLADTARLPIDVGFVVSALTVMHILPSARKLLPAFYAFELVALVGSLAVTFINRWRHISTC